MVAVIRGLGPDSFKIRCSNEDGAGMVIAVVLMSFRIIVAIPTPRPWRRQCMNIQGEWFDLMRSSHVGFARFQLNRESPDYCP